MTALTPRESPIETAPVAVERTKRLAWKNSLKGSLRSGFWRTKPRTSLSGALATQPLITETNICMNFPLDVCWSSGKRLLSAGMISRENEDECYCDSDDGNGIVNT